MSRYRLSAARAASDDPLDLHVLLRDPSSGESAALAALDGLRVSATPTDVETPADVPHEARAEWRPGTLLSGDASGWRAALQTLGSGGGVAAALARELRRALLPTRPRVWRLRTRQLPLERPLVMGIVNVTPDSFSDGGRFLDVEAALAHARGLAEAGADLLDVGGESTRPGSERVDPEEELRRVLPVVAALAADGALVSVDTSRADVARRAVRAGAEVINDVSGLTFDAEMAGVLGETGSAGVLMHMRGVPATMQERPWYQDVAGQVLERLGQALERARAAGVDEERCALDPGIGFGKRAVDNEELIRRMSELAGLGRPLLVGPSRKGFLDRERRLPPAERLPETLAAACLAAVGGARILRVHDVAECRRALDVVSRIEGWCGGEEHEGCPPGPTA